MSDTNQGTSVKNDQFSDIRNRTYARAWRTFYKPRSPSICFERGQKTKLYDLAADTFGSDPITYLEFGVHKGWSFSQIVNRFKNPGARFYGFDSFEGLPEDWANDMRKNHFSTDGATPSIDDVRTKFIKGWFQNTLPEFLAKQNFSSTVFVHFDADLYSSTLFLMTTLWHYIPDYYFIFDEFTPDEIVAMYDFVQAYPVDLEFKACTQDEHLQPLQVFGHLRRVPLVLT